MVKVWKVIVAVFAVGMLFFALGCDGGYEGCGGVDPDPGDGEAPVLDSTHSGWKVADCTACHNNTHTAGMGSYECASCHGDNGAVLYIKGRATTSHKGSSDCLDCHANRVRPSDHPEATIPFGTCRECH